MFVVEMIVFFVFNKVNCCILEDALADAFMVGLLRYHFH